MRVAILHNALSADSRPDESDVLVQVQQVAGALNQLGHSHEIVAVDLNLQDCVQRLRQSRPDAVFNLIEAFAGSDQLVSLAVAVVESLGIPLTGSPSDVLWLTNHKILAKQRFRLLGLPTADWLEADSSTSCESWATGRVAAGDRFILKPIGEHSSLGMDEGALAEVSNVEQLWAITKAHSERIGRPCFAERFVAGREFNVSLLAGDEACQVLPLAEIDFSKFPPDKPRIVDYKAKWENDSFEFQNTPRRFLASDEEPRLAGRLSELARACWTQFRLGGYARVDFRVDDSGQPWILEINTNPCLSPDAGFAAALRQGGIDFPRAVQRMLDDARRRPASSTMPAAVGGPAGGEANQSTSPVRSPAEPLVDAAVTWRFEVTDRDVPTIRELVAATGFFNPEEVAIAEELALERLQKGDASGYSFVLAECRGAVAGYASYGRIAGTRDSFDLYWIAVDPRHQGRGLGRMILDRSEDCIRRAGGRRVYIETSNREQYRSTRGFYLRCGYTCEAVLREFYGPGDDKVIYVKTLSE